MIVVIDFGGQTAHLITRRLKELGSPAQFVHPEDALAAIAKEKPQGIILSGGPASVYEDGAPTIDKAVFTQGIPVLGICYGLQLMAKMLGGEVVAGEKEYGPAVVEMARGKWQIAHGLLKKFTVWMSHGDEVTKLPKGFEYIGSTASVPSAFVQNIQQKLFGVQFHPEVEHTEFGKQILENFLTICGVKQVFTKIDTNKIIQGIASRVEEAYVIGAISGGVDSTVAGVLAAKAIGGRFIPVYVDTGMMRVGTEELVRKIFDKHHVRPIIVNGVEEAMARLAGKTDPEEKRKIIGKFYIDMFEQEMTKLVKSGKSVTFLLQGTIYSDVIESQGTKHAAKIKSHHNVGGLPKEMKLTLLEPLREFYKDEVRAIGKQLGLPDEFVWQQVFPGPGYGVRIRGEITKERLLRERQADEIVLEEIEKAGLMQKVYMSFPIMTGAQSTAVKGDGRFFGEVVALRIVESQDVMTAKWAHVPYEVLQKISSRIVNEVPGISRVVYDISSKPPATMEWE